MSAASSARRESARVASRPVPGRRRSRSASSCRAGVAAPLEDPHARRRRRRASRSARADRRRRAIISSSRCQLGPAERGQEVAEPVVVADLGVLVVGGRLPGLGAQVPHAVGDARSSVSSMPPPDCRHDLVAVERQRGRGAERAGRPAAVSGARAPRRRPRAPARRSAAQIGDDRRVVGAAAEQVDRDDRARPCRPSRAGGRRASSSSAGSRLPVSGSQSTKTGSAPV